MSKSHSLHPPRTNLCDYLKRIVKIRKKILIKLVTLIIILYYIFSPSIIPIDFELKKL